MAQTTTGDAGCRDGCSRPPHALGTADPSAPLSGTARSAPSRCPRAIRATRDNALTPVRGAARAELFGAAAATCSRFNLEPLGPEAVGVDRRDEATREMRRLVGTTSAARRCAGSTSASEAWRGFGAGGEPQLRRLLRHQLRPRRPLQLQGLLRDRSRPARRRCRWRCSASSRRRCR